MSYQPFVPKPSKRWTLFLLVLLAFLAFAAMWAGKSMRRKGQAAGSSEFLGLQPGQIAKVVLEVTAIPSDHRLTGRLLEKQNETPLHPHLNRSRCESGRADSDHDGKPFRCAERGHPSCHRQRRGEPRAPRQSSCRFNGVRDSVSLMNSPEVSPTTLPRKPSFTPSLSGTYWRFHCVLKA
jgi:hypothetical protein